MMIFKRLKFPVFITIILAVSFALAGCGEKTYNVAGKIVDSITNAGIPEVMIFTDSGLITQSSADGKYALTGVSGKVSIMLFKQDYRFDPISVSAENQNMVIKGILLEPPTETYQVSGRVIHADTGVGIRNVNVFAISNGQATITDQSGTFTISGLSGTASLYFFQEGWSFSPNPLEVTGEETELEIRRIPQALNIVEPKIAGGWGSTLMLKGDGSVWTWGYNSYGQLGNGTTTGSNLPGRALGLSNTMTVDAGRFHNMALKDDGTVWVWGYNLFGQLGNGTNTDSNIPVQASGLTGVVAIAGGKNHSMALKADKTVWVWGSNSYYQLGNGTGTDSNLPEQVDGLSNVIAISGGMHHSLALKADGNVWVWGDNSWGQLGDGTTMPSYVPKQVNGLNNVVAIAGGERHTIALKADGSVWTWGFNLYGQLGNGSNATSKVPVQVSGLSNIVAIAAGSMHSLALKDDGSVWAWGQNGYGELGVGNYDNTNTPVAVTF